MKDILAVVGQDVDNVKDGIGMFSFCFLDSGHGVISVYG